MAVTRTPLAVTTDAAGAGTVTSTNVVSGLIVEVRLATAGTALTGTGGTTSFTITRPTDGGTVLVASGWAAPCELPLAANREGVVPVNDYLRLVVAAGQPSKSGTVWVHAVR